MRDASTVGQPGSDQVQDPAPADVTEPAAAAPEPAVVRPASVAQRLSAFVGRHQMAIFVLATYLFAGYLLTINLWSDPNGLRIVGNPGDTALYQWWFGWWPHALATGQDPFATYAMNHPTGVGLMTNTSMALPALATSWLFETAGPLFTYNLLSALAPPLTAFAAYLCARRLGIREVAAFAGALVFGFSPAIVHSLVGHLSMAMAMLLPVAVLLAVLAWTTSRPRRVGLTLGVVAVVQVLTGEEVLFQAGLATLIILAVLAASRPRLIAARAATAARAYAWAVAVFVPITAYPLYLQFFGPFKAHGSPFWIDYFAADLAAFTTPTELNARGPGEGIDQLPGGITEHLAYLGWPLLILCALVITTRWADLRVRAAGVGFAVAGIFSMGGTLWVRGQQTKQPLPWGWLEKLPLLQSALPSRFGLLTALFAATLLALGLEHALAQVRLRPVIAAGAGVLAVAVLWTIAPAPLPVEPVPGVPAWFSTEARTLPAGTSALVVPFPTPNQTDPLRWQVAADYRYATPGGYFIAPGGDGHAYIGAAAGFTQQMVVKLEEEGVVPEVTPELKASVAADLAGWGTDLVVLGPCQNRDQLRTLLSQILVGTPEDVGGVTVWRQAQVAP
jgi:hypothetical protein